MDIGATGYEFGVIHQFTVQRDIGFDALHSHFQQRAAHPRHRLLAGIAVGDELAHHRVVIGRHKIVGIHMRIYPHAGPARCVPGGDASRRRHEVVGVFGVDTALDRMPPHLDLALGKGQLHVGRHHDLRLDDINAGDHFRHRVLHLHARVHFDEVELAVLVQEFESARAPVADLFAGSHTALADALDQLAADARCRRLFQDFLVPPLHRAIPLAQVDRVLELVGQDLDFDVAGVLQEFLHIDRGVAKCCAGFRLGHDDRVDQRRLGVYHPHAAPAAAAGGFDDDRIPHALGNTAQLHRVVRELALRARYAGDAGPDHGLFGRHLVAHDADGRGGGADELEAALLHALGKVGVFAQETVAGVDSFRVGHLGGRNDGRHIQVAMGRSRRADANRFVRQPNVFGFSVCFGIHHHRADIEFAARALDAQRNFATVGDQNFFEHGRCGPLTR